MFRLIDRFAAGLLRCSFARKGYPWVENAIVVVRIQKCSTNLRPTRQPPSQPPTCAHPSRRPAGCFRHGLAELAKQSQLQNGRKKGLSVNTTAKQADFASQLQHHARHLLADNRTAYIGAAAAEELPPPSLPGPPASSPVTHTCRTKRLMHATDDSAVARLATAQRPG